jgi:hypothetical protein
MSGSAGLSPFRVHVTDQILAALTEVTPRALSTTAVEARTGYGRGHGRLVHQLLTRLASAGAVDKITPPGTRPCFWRVRPADNMSQHRAAVAS